MTTASSLLDYVFAALPILAVLALILVARWSGQRAGIAGLLAGIAVGALAFGLNLDILTVALIKGVLLALVVLAVLWPALLLYNLAARAGGIMATAQYLESLIADRDLLLIVVAWAFSGMLEGLAGFGLPIAIVAPILVNLGAPPVIAVAAVAVGHSWSITFGDMGVIYQTLIAVTGLDGAILAPYAALLLGVTCVGCGLGAARLLGAGHKWRSVIVLGLLMAVIQYAVAAVGLTSLAALAAGAGGILGALLVSRSAASTSRATEIKSRPALTATLLAYGGLTALMTAIALIQPVHQLLHGVVWQAQFPAVSTNLGMVIPAGPGPAFRFLTHPGTAILIVFILGLVLFRRAGLIERGGGAAILATTWRAAGPATVSVLAMVCLSMVMEYTGMTMLLARGLSALLGSLFPLVSPMVGILGAFATGSNNNSNVLFGALQVNVAGLLGFAPAILVAAQTTGGALGSMVAPAKLILGCGTVGLQGHDGEVLRKTLGYALWIGLSVGVVALILCLLD